MSPERTKASLIYLLGVYLLAEQQKSRKDYAPTYVIQLFVFISVESAYSIIICSI